MALFWFERAADSLVWFGLLIQFSLPYLLGAITAITAAAASGNRPVALRSVGFQALIAITLGALAQPLSILLLFALGHPLVVEDGTAILPNIALKLSVLLGAGLIAVRLWLKHASTWPSPSARSWAMAGLVLMHAGTAGYVLTANRWFYI